MFCSVHKRIGNNEETAPSGACENPRVNVTLPALGVVTKWVRWQTDLADAPKTSIDVKVTICEDLCTGQTTTTMLVGHARPSPVPQMSGTAMNIVHCHAGLWARWHQCHGTCNIESLRVNSTRLMTGGSISSCTVHNDAHLAPFPHHVARLKSLNHLIGCVIVLPKTL